MKCVICKQGETRLGYTTIVLEQQETTILLKAVPAQICEICGEAYVSEETTRRILEMADEARRPGVQTEIRIYAEAV